MRSINPACKFLGILIFTLILSTQRNPALHLSVFILCLLLLILSKVNLKHLLLALLPVGVTAAAMFFTGFYFSASSGGPVNADNLSLAGSRLQNGLTLSSRVLASSYRMGRQIRMTPAVVWAAIFARSKPFPSLRGETISTREKDFSCRSRHASLPVETHKMSVYPSSPSMEENKSRVLGPLAARRTSVILLHLIFPYFNR